MTYENLGFTWQATAAGHVLIYFRGRHVTTLRGERAHKFLVESDGADEDEMQQDLARLTGNFCHGNEDMARKHPRNH